MCLEDLLSKSLAVSCRLRACELLMPGGSDLLSGLEQNTGAKMPTKEAVELRQVLSVLAQTSSLSVYSRDLMQGRVPVP